MQLVTNGLKITDYRPSDSDKPVDIIVRVPEDRRTLDQIDELEISTPAGSVPISNFVQRVPEERVGLINRVDSQRVVTVTSNLTPGVLASTVQDQITKQLQATDFKGLVTWKLVGSDEEQANAESFLLSAFGAAIFLIFAVLLAQFNKLSSVALVLSAVVLSTIGVFIGLNRDGQAFGVVMTGVGIIALAGIVTNNNIVLIDTYDRLRREGVPVRGSHPQDLSRTRAAGAAHCRDRGARRAADRLRPQRRLHPPRDHLRGAVDAVVDPAFHRHRVRPDVLDRADTGRHAVVADALARGRAAWDPPLALAAEDADGSRRRRRSGACPRTRRHRRTVLSHSGGCLPSRPVVTATRSIWYLPRRVFPRKSIPCLNARFRVSNSLRSWRGSLHQCRRDRRHAAGAAQHGRLVRRRERQ